MSTIKDVKEALTNYYGGLPSNKQQLKGKIGFLKDNQTLASVNIGDGEILELSLRSRGGKK